MTPKKLNVSEARRQFSRLVGGVSKRGTCIAITQHGKEQAALIGMAEYRALSEKPRPFADAQGDTSWAAERTGPLSTKLRTNG